LADFFVHLSAVCRDLGGRTLIWGGGRHRGPIPETDAEAQAAAFMAGVARRIENHGTVFCFEPLGPRDSDFINSAHTSLRIVEEVDHPSLAVQLDAKALAENDEITPGLFDAVRPRLVHVHANEPGLAVIGSSGTVDHGEIGRQLRRTGYDGFVSVEQRMLNAEAPLADIAASVDAVWRHYVAPGAAAPPQGAERR
jgi:sugar phosphate isomerase/epimerase